MPQGCAEVVAATTHIAACIEQLRFGAEMTDGEFVLLCRLIGRMPEPTLLEIVARLRYQGAEQVGEWLAARVPAPLG